MAISESRPIDSLGRVVIPKSIRSHLGWAPGAFIAFDIVDSNAVMMRKAGAGELPSFEEAIHLLHDVLQRNDINMRVAVSKLAELQELSERG